MLGRFLSRAATVSCKSASEDEAMAAAAEHGRGVHGMTDTDFTDENVAIIRLHTSRTCRRRPAGFPRTPLTGRYRRRMIDARPLTSRGRLTMIESLPVDTDVFASKCRQSIEMLRSA